MIHLTAHNRIKPTELKERRYGTQSHEPLPTDLLALPSECVCTCVRVCVCVCIQEMITKHSKGGVKDGGHRIEPCGSFLTESMIQGWVYLTGFRLVSVRTKGLP